MVTSKNVDGVLMYLCTIETNAEGYLSGAGMDDNGDTWLIADELSALVPDATKLVDGHLIVDEQQAVAVTAKPEPTAQDTINAQLLKATAQSQLANATLLKQMATMQEVVNNG